jgi:predicted Zn finger-like uncharacterized protein
MRIICPACETAYDVPEAALAPGRILRCARCRSEWVPVPAEDAPQQSIEETIPAPPTAAPPPKAMETLFGRMPDPVAAARPAGPRVSVIAGWLLSFLLLGALGYASVRWRQPIEQAWPPSSRAYAYLGYR